MSISGHQTVSMFLRYNITSEDDKREALLRTQAHLSANSERSNLVVLPENRDRKGTKEKKELAAIAANSLI